MSIKQLIHQSNLIEGYDDQEFDTQGMVAWHYLEKVKNLHQGDIRKVQKILTLRQTDLQPDWRGSYRKIPVWVGGREGMNWTFIENAMHRWLDDLPDKDPIAAHIEFEHIHPFVDGNGRTGRLLMWWTQKRRGEPYTQLTAANRQDYYRWFK